MISRVVTLSRAIRKAAQDALKVEQRNHTVLREMLDHAAGVEASREARRQDKATETDSIVDTGAMVYGTNIMQDLGLRFEDLLPTNLTLFAANRKGLTVLGAVPVLITAKTVDGGQPVTTRDLLYIVEKLTFMFLSRDALVNLGSISMSFPSIPNPRSYGWVAGVQQGSNADTVIEQPCLKPDKFEGELADCGCPMRAAAPEPPAMPFPANEENKGKLKQFLVDTYRASTFNPCQRCMAHHWSSLWRRMPDLMQSSRLQQFLCIGKPKLRLTLTGTWPWVCWRRWGIMSQ